MQAQLNTLIDAVRQAGADGRTLRLRGGGSKDFLGAPLSGEVLDTRVYAGIVGHEPSELVVTARGGTSLAELEATLADKGQCLAFEPPHFGDGATVGGMVAAGLSGPARASVGSVRDFVLGMQLVNGRGECLSFGGQVMKNVAGYDVGRVLVGSMGTLGLIAQVSLKVVPFLPAEATWLFEMDQAAALQQLNQWGGQPLPLNASCWVRDDGRDCLFVRLRGAAAAVAAAAQVMRERGGALVEPAQAQPDWLACRDQTLPFFQAPDAQACLWRLSVPSTTLAMDLPSSPLIEWHGALRWVWAPASAAERLRTLAAAVGGHATLFRPSADSAPGVARFTETAPAVQAIERRLRVEFDPAGIFNTGRM